jgi:hypothetical protein
MPRARFEDDPRDDDFPARRGRSNSGLLIGLLVGGGILVVLVCGGGLAAFFFARTAVREREADARAEVQAVRQADRRVVADAAERAVPNPQPADRPLLSRKDFEAAVRGKTRDQIIAAVGRPDETREQTERGKVLTPGGRDTGERIGSWTVEWWVYRDRVANDATGKPYPTVRVRIGPQETGDMVEYR